MGFSDSEGLGVVGGDGGGRWDFVRFDGNRLGVVNIMVLRDALSVEFQIKELHDRSLNARLALGITKMKTDPGWIVGEWVRTRERWGSSVPGWWC